MATKTRRRIRGVFFGLLFLLLLHILAWSLAIAFGAVLYSNHSFLAFYFGLLSTFWIWQLFYAIPAVALGLMKGSKGTATGILIGIVISAIINVPFGASIPLGLLIR